MYYNEEDYLIHYGVLGMRWGVRVNRKNYKTLKKHYRNADNLDNFTPTSSMKRVITNRKNKKMAKEWNDLYPRYDELLRNTKRTSEEHKEFYKLDKELKDIMIKSRTYNDKQAKRLLGKYANKKVDSRVMGTSSDILSSYMISKSTEYDEKSRKDK